MWKLVLDNKEGTKAIAFWANCIKATYLISSASAVPSMRTFWVIDYTLFSLHWLS